VDVGVVCYCRDETVCLLTLGFKIDAWEGTREINECLAWKLACFAVSPMGHMVLNRNACWIYLGTPGWNHSMYV
jgi:hypothetical protein